MKNALTINKVSKFIRRLYKIVSDENIKNIRWTEDGNSIRIINKQEFMKNTLPLLSKTREYSAFIRQLNLYGFIKVKSGNLNQEEYYHSSFQRGKEESLPHVKHDKDKSINVYEGKPRLIDIDPRYKEAIECLSRQNYRLEADVLTLKERVDKQECTINGLIEILSRMFTYPKPEENSLQLTNNLQNFENLKIAHTVDKYQDKALQDRALSDKALLDKTFQDKTYQDGAFQDRPNQLIYNAPDSQNIYQLARRNFENNNYSSNHNYPSNHIVNEKKNKDSSKHRTLRNEIFGESDETDEDIFDDGYY